MKCAGTQNVSDALTKSLPRLAFEKHKEYMIGTRVPFAAFYTSILHMTMPLVAYRIKLLIPFPPSEISLCFVQEDNLSPTQGESEVAYVNMLIRS